MPKYPLHKAKNKQVVVSLGGSLINPGEVNESYLIHFRNFILKQVDAGWRFFIVTGGGAPAREYINAARNILGKEITKDDMDWLGIHATRFNAHLVRTLFRKLAQPSIITDPEVDEIDEQSQIVVVSGWKPGWSTDFVSAKIAQRIKAEFIINLSNITQVYSDDPKKNPNARPLEFMSWPEFRKMVGNDWDPGMNAPFDPIAAKLAQEEKMTVLVMDGTNLVNLKKLMAKGEFVGTVIM